MGKYKVVGGVCRDGDFVAMGERVVEAETQAGAIKLVTEGIDFLAGFVHGIHTGKVDRDVDELVIRAKRHDHF